MSSLAKVEEENERMAAMVRNIRTKAKSQTQAYVRTAIVSGTGFALGAVEAKFGEDAAFGMSPSLMTGLVGHGLALLDVGGKDATQHLQSVGDAGLCVYAFKQGSDMMTRYMEDEPAATP